jgi:hypothetical protein
VGVSSSTKQATLNIAPPPPDRSKPERDVIFTANGSAESVYHVRRVGALIGMESMNARPPEKYDVNFLDWPFTKLEEFDDHDALFERHKQAVRAERPKYAVAPDIDGTFPAETIYDMADELAEYASIVVVTPKAVHPSAVPCRFRVGVPCQPRFGPPPWPTKEYRSVKSAHLLGGSPTTHRKKIKYITVDSVDTVAPVKSAHFGSYWTGKKWLQAPEGTGFYTCLKRSYSGLRRMLNHDREIWSPRCRNRKEDYIDNFREHHPDADLWHQNDELPYHGWAIL